VSDAGPILVCFAVKEEAKPFRKLARQNLQIKILITGVGKANATRSICQALKVFAPNLVLSCGFAGGLNPQLKTGDIIFSVNDSGLSEPLQKLGAKTGFLHCAETIATTSLEKQNLWRETKADVVEMESHWIEAICREHNVPCATIRVVLDTAGEDLPLDFNSLMSANQEIDFANLALAIIKSPTKIPALIRLQQQSKAAAQKLAEVLAKIIPL
jgi:adenosylhomocysteine nucleosidase